MLEENFKINRMAAVVKRKGLKKNYQDAFLSVRTLLNEFDPCGVIQAGAPEDEYDCLTEKLLISVRDDKSREELRALVLSEIQNHFEEPDLKTMEEPSRSRFYQDLEYFVGQVKSLFPSP